MVSTVASHLPVSAAAPNEKEQSAAKPGFQAALDTSLKAAHPEPAPGRPAAPLTAPKQKAEEPARGRAEKKRDGESATDETGQPAPIAGDLAASMPLLPPPPPVTLIPVSIAVPGNLQSGIDRQQASGAVSGLPSVDGVSPASAPALVQTSADVAALLPVTANLLTPTTPATQKPAVTPMEVPAAPTETGAAKELASKVKTQASSLPETPQPLQAEQPASIVASVAAQSAPTATPSDAARLPVPQSSAPQHTLKAAESSPVPNGVAVPTFAGTHGLSHENGGGKAQGEGAGSKNGESAAGDQKAGADAMPARFGENLTVTQTPVPAHEGLTGISNHGEVAGAAGVSSAITSNIPARDAAGAGARVVVGPPVSVDQAVAPQPINTARVLQSMNGTEMRVGMHSQEFGSISIATAVSPGGVAAQIALDHGALARALANHLPAIEDKLGSALGVSARVEVRDAGLNLSQGGGNDTGGDASAGAGSQRGSQGGAAGSYAVLRAAETTYTASASSDVVVNAGGSTRLSVQA